MRVECSYEGCGERRIHHERPDEPRGKVLVEVPDGHDDETYCSITCAAMDGYFDREKKAMEKALAEEYQRGPLCAACGHLPRQHTKWGCWGSKGCKCAESV